LVKFRPLNWFINNVSLKNTKMFKF
jgi:hypothetical protein